MNTDTSFFTLGVLCVGTLIGLLGALMLLYRAFHESIVWGLVILFVPLGNVIFTCVHWSEAKHGFLTWLVGVAIIGGSMVISPEVQKSIWEGRFAKDEDQQQMAQEKRKLLEELQGAFATYGRDLPAEYQQLEKRRTSLKAGDEAALAKFNEDAAAYQAKNKRHRQIQQEINAAQAELDELLDQRSRAAVKGHSTAVGGGHDARNTASSLAFTSPLLATLAVPSAR